MNKSLTIKELFSEGVKGFSPLNIDISEIKALSESIPASGEIDINQCEVLATKMLRGADLCADLLSIATVYATKCETNKKRAYSDAAISKASAAGIKTDKARILYADGDNDYIEACNKCGEAQAFVKWLVNKNDSLIRAHYMFKQMLTRNYSNERASSFSPDPEKMVEDMRSEEETIEKPIDDDFGKDW